MPSADGDGVQNTVSVQQSVSAIRIFKVITLIPKPIFSFRRPSTSDIPRRWRGYRVATLADSKFTRRRYRVQSVKFALRRLIDVLARLLLISL